MKHAFTPQLGETSVLSAWCRALVDAEVPRGERSSLLRRLGVPEEQLAKHDEVVTQQSANALWAHLTDDHTDPLFGYHFVERAAVGSIGVVGYLVMSSVSALAALERVMKYHRLLKRVDAAELHVTAREVRVVENPPPGHGPFPRHLAEAIFAAYVTNLARCSTVAITPLRLTFQHPRPAAAREVERAFGCEVTFGAANNEIAFRRAELDAPLRTHDPVLGAILEGAADRMLAELPREPELLASVRRAVAELLPSGDVSIERVAARLGMGPRTLQRRLRDLDVSFREVVESVRRAAAERLMRERGVNATNVAFMLGFSDASSLRRAHRRWRAAAPGAAPR